MDKFESSSTAHKCKLIYSHFSSYSTALKFTEQTKSEDRIKQFDDSAELSFRLASKQLNMLSSDELTEFMNFIKERLLETIKLNSRKTKPDNVDGKMLNTRLMFSTILRQLPETLTPEQQAIKTEMENIVSNYFVKIENVM